MEDKQITVIKTPYDKYTNIDQLGSDIVNENCEIYEAYSGKKKLCQVIYTPIKKELYRSIEDRVLIDFKSVSKQMYKDKLRGYRYGYLELIFDEPLKSLMRSDKELGAIKTIEEIVKDKQYGRILVSIVNKSNSCIFTDCNFSFIENLNEDDYLMFKQ